MRVDILTIFPEMFRGPLDASILGLARARGILDLRVRNLRDWATDRHKVVDDTPYGGGAGMVMKVEPIVAALEGLRAEGTAAGLPPPRVVLLSPAGARFDQAAARRLAALPWLILVCGRYEGVDARVRHFVDEELSIGDYVLTGGELPAMVVVDAVTRLLPGALGEPASTAEESFAAGLLEYPQFTRPREFRGLAVPDVLLSGHHAEIARWRRREALRLTAERRPDLLARAELTAEDRAFLASLGAEPGSGRPVPGGD
ncbi:MAG TPA: tRNA (guanosine(37)-N1)-methyltransferase TrmD [Thermodesulfobacteriota bacterium]|nr:tRNA (guanosine(37)-N1)-methyltransferase TrmD [Thermodesulfobacteriota bacterium]